MRDYEDGGLEMIKCNQISKKLENNMDETPTSKQ
jgi:hypothetical protein